MRHVRKLLLAGVASGLIAGPAMAWEFGISDRGDIFWTAAEDLSGVTTLAFYCRQSAPGAIQVQVAIGETGPDRPVPVELGFEVAGRSFGPIPAVAESADGMLAVTTRTDSTAVAAAARAIYAEGSMVVLTYYESSWRFNGAHRSDDFGAMLDACG